MMSINDVGEEQNIAKEDPNRILIQKQLSENLMEENRHETETQATKGTEKPSDKKI